MNCYVWWSRKGSKVERISRCNARIRGGIPLGHGGRGVAEVIVPFGLAKAGLFSGCPSYIVCVKSPSC